MGPVHEKLTKAKTKAIKNIPINPRLSAFASALFTHALGILISKAPIKETAKMIRIAKKTKLKVGFVDILFNTSAPKTAVTTVPSKI